MLEETVLAMPRLLSKCIQTKHLLNSSASPKHRDDSIKFITKFIGMFLNIGKNSRGYLKIHDSLSKKCFSSSI